MKFGQSMYVDDPKVDPEGQGHRSKVKVTRSKKCCRCVCSLMSQWSFRDADTCSDLGEAVLKQTRKDFYTERITVIVALFWL